MLPCGELPSNVPVGNNKVKLHLKIDPELRIGADAVAKPYSRIVGERALAI